MASAKPAISAFLTADKVIQEKGSNKWSAIGIFSRIFVAGFPCIHRSLALYIRLSDAQGDYDVKVEFCDSSGRVLAVFEGIHIRIPSKLEHPDLGINTAELPLPREGRYNFRLYFNNELVQSIPIDVVKVTADK